MKMLTVLFLACSLFSSAAIAQEATPTPVPACTEADRAVLVTCKTACEVQVPQCKKDIVDLEALRLSIAAKCKCEKARNFGQYRACVNTVINPMRAFALLDAAAKATINADNAACRKIIADKAKGNKGKGNVK